MNNKVSALILVFLISLSVSLAAVSIKSNVPDMGLQETSLRGNVVVTSTASDSYVDVIVMLPEGTTFDSWKVEGVDVKNVDFETKNVDYMGMTRSSGHWLIRQKFTGDATIEYNFRTYSPGKYEAIAIATHQGGFTDATESITIMPIGIMTCGDGKCESWENEVTCSQDCALPISLKEIITYDRTMLVLGIILAVVFVISLLSYLGFWSWIRGKTIKSSEQKVHAFLRTGEKKGYSLHEMSDALKSERAEKSLRGIVSKEVSEVSRKETVHKRTYEKQAISKDKKMIARLEKIARNLRK